MTLAWLEKDESEQGRTSEHLVQRNFTDEGEFFFSYLGVDDSTLTLIDTSDDGT